MGVYTRVVVVGGRGLWPVPIDSD